MCGKCYVYDLVRHVSLMYTTMYCGMISCDIQCICKYVLFAILTETRDYYESVDHQHCYLHCTEYWYFHS